MTREEAIQYIDGLHCEEDFPYTDAIADFVKERNEAIDMAIEALQSEETLKTQLANCHKEILRLLDFNDITESPDDVIESRNDVIEVVRCKDCKWWEYVQGDGDCIRHTSDTLGYVFETNAEDFCSFGERRGE